MITGIAERMFRVDNPAAARICWTETAPVGLLPINPKAARTMASRSSGDDVAVTEVADLIVGLAQPRQDQVGVLAGEYPRQRLRW